MAIIYPPHIASTVPAFDSAYLKVPFTDNSTVLNYTGMVASIKDLNNNLIGHIETQDINNNIATFDLSGKTLTPGQYYKIQIAYTDQLSVQTNYSNLAFSSASVGRYIGDTYKIGGITINGTTITATINFNLPSETPYSYRFIIENQTTLEVEDSGEILLKSSDIQNNQVSVSYEVKNLSSSETQVYFETTSINGYKTSEYKDSIIFSYTPGAFNPYLSVEQDYENGRIELKTNYSNLIPISTDKDNNIYNGKGFKENTFLMYNTGDEYPPASSASAFGAAATGFIPINGNNIADYSENYSLEYGHQVLYFKNIKCQIPQSFEERDNQNPPFIIIFYDKDKNYLGYRAAKNCFTEVKYTEYTNNWHYVYFTADNNNYISSLDISTFCYYCKYTIVGGKEWQTPVGYIRISALGIDENSTITINTNKLPANLTILRHEPGQTWEEYKTIAANGSDLTIYDEAVTQGKTYEYTVRESTTNGYKYLTNVSGELITTSPIEAQFEDAFLVGQGKTLRIRFNPKVSSFKDTILESKMDTIGGKYPFFFRNGDVRYKEIPISGLLSYQIDESQLFMTDEELGLISDVANYRTATDANTNSQPEIARVRSTSLADYNITAERRFKLAVLEWLNNGKPKLFKSPTEGNYIVRLMNVSLTPEDQLGRMLHNFSATGYECMDNTLDNFNTKVWPE